MNGQPITKSKDKGANKNKSKNQQSPGKSEIQTQSSVPKGSMIATNLMVLLDAASSIELQSSPNQKSPPRGFHQTADKPQAASAIKSIDVEISSEIFSANSADATSKKSFLFRVSHQTSQRLLQLKTLAI